MQPGVPETDLLENEAVDMGLNFNPDLFDGLLCMMLTEDEAEIIIGARINTTKGLNTPPVKNNSPTNCEISNNKNKKVFLSVKVCLLYTSPSPRDRTRSRMPSSA